MEALGRRAKVFARRAEGANCYDILSLPRSAERREIRASYVALMRQYHPDNYYRRANRELLTALEDVCQTITQAYETLIDPSRRAIYDDEIRNFESPLSGGSKERAQRLRARKFEERNPRMANLAVNLMEESRAAVADLNFKDAVRKLKLALTYHPHMAEAQEMLRTLEQEGHGG